MCNRNCYKKKKKKKKIVGDRLENITNLGIAVLKTELCNSEYENQCIKTNDLDAFGDLIDNVVAIVNDRMKYLRKTY